jgi:hypothetical protein
MFLYIMVGFSIILWISGLVLSVPIKCFLCDESRCINEGPVIEDSAGVSLISMQ